MSFAWFKFTFLSGYFCFIVLNHLVYLDCRSICTEHCRFWMKSCIKYLLMEPEMFVFHILIITNVVCFRRSRRKKKLNNFKDSRVIHLNYYLFVDTGFVSKFCSKFSCLGLKFEEISPDLIFRIVLCNICTFTTVFWLLFGVRFAFILSVF